MDVKPSISEKKNVNFASEGAVLILDEKNQIVQGQASELSKKADQLFQATEGEFEYQMQKKKYQVVYRVSDTTKWKVIGIIPLREISADLLPIQKQMIKTLMQDRMYPLSLEGLDRAMRALTRKN